MGTPIFSRGSSAGGIIFEVWILAPSIAYIVLVGLGDYRSLAETRGPQSVHLLIGLTLFLLWVCAIKDMLYGDEGRSGSIVERATRLDGVFLPLAFANILALASVVNGPYLTVKYVVIVLLSVSILLLAFGRVEIKDPEGVGAILLTPLLYVMLGITILFPRIPVELSSRIGGGDQAGRWVHSAVENMGVGHGLAGMVALILIESLRRVYRNDKPNQVR